MASNKSAVTLQEVTAENVRSICELSVNEEQKAYVAPCAITVAEACYSRGDWLQAIYAEENPVGLAVVKIGSDQAGFFLWRFMIDARYQGLKYGRGAINLLI